MARPCHAEGVRATRNAAFQPGNPQVRIVRQNGVTNFQELSMKPILPATLIFLGLAAPALAQNGRMREPQTRAEFQAAQKAQFANFDADGDGVVTKAEVSAAMEKRIGNPPPPQMVDMLFARMDTNGDGKVTAAEADAAAMARFDAWDTDHNGTLTPEERRAGMQAMRAARPQ
jgi:hypothetical protein